MCNNLPSVQSYVSQISGILLEMVNVCIKIQNLNLQSVSTFLHNNIVYGKTEHYSCGICDGTSKIKLLTWERFVSG
jgi:hypothetical protein